MARLDAFELRGSEEAQQSSRISSPPAPPALETGA